MRLHWLLENSAFEPLSTSFSNGLRHRALGGMSFSTEPTPDRALMVYLLCVVALMGSAAASVYWLMQPTVLVNAGIAAFDGERRVPVVLTPVAPDNDRIAVATALHENEKQGLQSIASVAPTAETAPASARVARAVEPRPKAKRTAKVQRRQLASRLRNAWAYAPSASFGPFGGFGPGMW